MSIDISKGLYRAVLAIAATANRVITFPDRTFTVADAADVATDVAALAAHEIDSSTHNVVVIVGTTETQTLSGKTFSDTIKGESSDGSAVFFGDVSHNTVLTIANGATANPFSNANNFSGLFVITETNVSGESALVLGGGGFVIVSQTGTLYTVTAGTASKVNIYHSGGALVIQNNSGSSRNFQIMALRTRASL